LTSGFPWNNKVPSWSRDGKWIYFTSDRTGRWEIWRTAAQGGPAEQITTAGGYVALESRDGKTLYYTKMGFYGGEPLYARALGGGEERQVLEQVAGRGFHVFGDGIYYCCNRTANSGDPISRVCHSEKPRHWCNWSATGPRSLRFRGPKDILVRTVCFPRNQSHANRELPLSQ
jgi:hypothetical protein